MTDNPSVDHAAVTIVTIKRDSNGNVLWESNLPDEQLERVFSVCHDSVMKNNIIKATLREVEAKFGTASKLVDLDGKSIITPRGQ